MVLFDHINQHREFYYKTTKNPDMVCPFTLPDRLQFLAT
jgi:hypothetical protein